MEEVMKVIDGILSSLDKFERPLEVLLITGIFMLERRLKKSSSVSSPVQEVKPQKTLTRNASLRVLQDEYDALAELRGSYGYNYSELNEEDRLEAYSLDDQLALLQKLIKTIGG